MEVKEKVLWGNQRERSNETEEEEDRSGWVEVQLVLSAYMHLANINWLTKYCTCIHVTHTVIQCLQYHIQYVPILYTVYIYSISYTVYILYTVLQCTVSWLRYKSKSVTLPTSISNKLYYHMRNFTISRTTVALALEVCGDFILWFNVLFADSSCT